MLWQYIGQLGSENALKEFGNNLIESNLKWGIRGAQLTKQGLIEGAGTDQFLKMAKRAAGLFSKGESMIF